MLLTDEPIKTMNEKFGLSRPSISKYTKAVINEAGCKTRAEFMAKEIDRLRKQLKER